MRSPRTSPTSRGLLAFIAILFLGSPGFANKTSKPSKGTPTITSLNPTSGPVNRQVTITGTNFGAGQGSSTVTFSGVAAARASAWSATSITVNVPTIAAGNANVVVTVGGLPSNSVTFNVTTVTPPLVTMSPVRGGITVTQPLWLTATESTNSGVAWSTSGGSLSNVTSSSATFVATSPGVYTITARSNADNTRSASAVIGVTDLAGVYTWRNDGSRSGVNRQEYALTPQNVTTSTFGKLFTCTVDGYVFAQPLWAANLPIQGTQHNVVFVATENDSLYAFDADGPTCTSVWASGKVSLIPSGETIAAPADLQTDVALGSAVGITGTPVIDAVSHTIYLVALTKNSTTGQVIQRLHAIDILTGQERQGSPVVISASVNGSGYDNVNGVITFRADHQKQRSALLLANGVVYVGFAGFITTDPYHGWLMGYDAATLAQVSVYNTTPDNRRGAIWMAGGGPAADALGNIYLITGNGSFNGDTGGRNFGDTFLKLSTSGGLSVADSFTPFDQLSKEVNDMDFGSSAPILLPDQSSGPVLHLAFGCEKAGTCYVLNRDNLGAYNPTDNSQIVQSFRLSASNEMYSTPLFWQNTLYGTPSGSPLSAFPFSPSTGRFQTSPSSVSTQTFGYPGTTPALSATGASNGIIWALQRTSATTPAVLHAYDASNLRTELWNSSQAAGGRDQAGWAVRFFAVTVANGKVYVGTQTTLDVYGLLPN